MPLPRDLVSSAGEHESHRINFVRKLDIHERATLARYTSPHLHPPVIFPLHLQDLPDGLPSLYALSLEPITDFAAVCRSACNCEGEAMPDTFIHVLTRIMHGIEARQ